MCLVILLKINKYSKIGFFSTILLFHLTLYFKIKNHKKFLFNTEKVIQ